MGGYKKKEKTFIEYPDTHTFRIEKDNKTLLTDALREKMKKENRSSMSNTIETALLEFFGIIKTHK